MTVSKKTKKSEHGLFGWQEALSGLGSSFFKNFADSLADKIKHRIQEMIVALQRGLLGTVLVMIGSIFILISLVIFLNEFLALGDWFGYIFVGIFSVLVGLLIIKK